MENENSRSATNTRLMAAAGVLDLMSFTLPADDPQEKESRNFCVNTEMLRILEGRLSRTETDFYASWRSNVDAALDSREEARLWGKFDDVLIEQAATLGWRMYESSLVLTRIAFWSDHDWNGMEKLKRFNAAINRNAELKRGMRRQPVTEPEWYQTRKSAMREIKALSKKLGAQFAMTQGRKTPNLAEQYVAIRTEITGNPLSYRYLGANLTSFMNYLKEQDSASETVAPLTARFVTSQVTPASILDGWFDCQGGTSNGKSRQIISRIGKQKHR